MVRVNPIHGPIPTKTAPLGPRPLAHEKISFARNESHSVSLGRGSWRRDRRHCYQCVSKVTKFKTRIGEIPKSFPMVHGCIRDARNKVHMGPPSTDYTLLRELSPITVFCFSALCSTENPRVATPFIYPLTPARLITRGTHTSKEVED